MSEEESGPSLSARVTIQNGSMPNRAQWESLLLSLQKGELSLEGKRFFGEGETIFRAPLDKVKVISWPTKHAVEIRVRKKVFCLNFESPTLLRLASQHSLRFVPAFLSAFLFFLRAQKKRQQIFQETENAASPWREVLKPRDKSEMKN